MISTIHDATIVNRRRKEGKINMEIRKPYAVVQYNKFIKGVDMADQHLSYYSVLKENCKMVKRRVVLYLLNCALQHVCCVQDTKYKQSKVQEFPAEGRKVLDIRSTEWQ
jgi:hypothetical protein